MKAHTICNAQHQGTGARCNLFAGHVGSHEGWGTWASGLSGWVRWWSKSSPYTASEDNGEDAESKLVALRAVVAKEALALGEAGDYERAERLSAALLASGS